MWLDQQRRPRPATTEGATKLCPKNDVPNPIQSPKGGH
jgi:hypothetical protein